MARHKLLLLLLLASPALANDPNNLPLHEIGAGGDVKVYKMVHFGCEIFVAVGEHGHTADLVKEWPTPVAITTGRGCK